MPSAEASADADQADPPDAGGVAMAAMVSLKVMGSGPPSIGLPSGLGLIRHPCGPGGSRSSGIRPRRGFLSSGSRRSAWRGG